MGLTLAITAKSHRRSAYSIQYYHATDRYQGSETRVDTQKTSRVNPPKKPGKNPTQIGAANN